MKMEEMKAYLELKGFEVMYKRNSVRDGYDFVISKNNKHCYGWYQWPADQMSFMNNLIDNFVKEFGCAKNYEPEFLWPKRNPYSSMYQNGTKPKIKNVIFNDPATIVFWTDGTKTVVKCQEGDTFDPEKGLAMAITKKIFGNKGNYCNEIKKWVGIGKQTVVEHVEDAEKPERQINKELVLRAYYALKNGTDKRATKMVVMEHVEDALKYLTEALED